jgi:hypothetical protein
MVGYIPKCIDHKDQNKLNNAWCNLREASHQQNNLNKCTHQYEFKWVREHIHIVSPHIPNKCKHCSLKVVDASPKELHQIAVNYMYYITPKDNHKFIDCGCPTQCLPTPPTIKQYPLTLSMWHKQVKRYHARNKLKSASPL